MNTDKTRREKTAGPSLSSTVFVGSAFICGYSSSGVIVAAEKALGLVLRTTDWSETSRIATLWTREFGKVRVLAKGGRRLKYNFETALDLLTLCRIVFL